VVQQNQLRPNTDTCPQTSTQYHCRHRRASQVAPVQAPHPMPVVLHTAVKQKMVSILQAERAVRGTCTLLYTLGAQCCGRSARGSRVRLYRAARAEQTQQSTNRSAGLEYVSGSGAANGRQHAVTACAHPLYSRARKVTAYTANSAQQTVARRPPPSGTLQQQA